MTGHKCDYSNNKFGADLCAGDSSATRFFHQVEGEVYRYRLRAVCDSHAMYYLAIETEWRLISEEEFVLLEVLDV